MKQIQISECDSSVLHSLVSVLSLSLVGLNLCRIGAEPLLETKFKLSSAATPTPRAVLTSTQWEFIFLSSFFVQGFY